MDDTVMAVILLVAPALMAGVAVCLPSVRAIFVFSAAGAAVYALIAGVWAWRVPLAGYQAAAGWFRLDALSAYHLLVLVAVFLLSSLFAILYFNPAHAHGNLTLRQARRYGGLWFGTLAAMVLVLLSNNIAIMWVGVEATTLFTAFLICIESTPASLEAMWKYLLMCSVGVALAFMGVLLFAAATAQAGLVGTQCLLWSNLMSHAGSLNPALVKAGFIFIVVGYGTKAGLAPMHNWLPDAHSQAPAPVSALFSGFLLNTALYCILRVLPVVEITTGATGWGRGILIVAGLLSILVAAVFIVSQHDVKRLLAYSSVEHMGIISLGAGLGGVGAVAALLHTLGHALAKPLAFFCAGRLGQIYGTHDMRDLRGVLRDGPPWGAGLVGGLLTLIGTAPFVLFFSEFMVLKAACDGRQYVVAAIFLAGLAVVFIGALRLTIAMAWDTPAKPPPVATSMPSGRALVFGTLAVLLVLGVWLPPPLLSLINRAAAVMGGVP